MPYIYVESLSLTDDCTLLLDSNQSHYVTNVLRCSEGDIITIFDNRGGYFEARIVRATKKNVHLHVTPLTPPDSESSLHITLCQGILKGYKMDMVVQKSTELGVKNIIPLISDRCQVRKTRKIERWKKIAEESARQCRRLQVTGIEEETPFNDLMGRITNSNIRCLFFYEKYGKNIKEIGEISPSTDVFIFIGPEGGFSDDEAYMAESKGMDIVNMGKRILRAETTSLSAVTLVQFLYGDMSISANHNQ